MPLTREDLKLVLQFFFTFAITAGSIVTGAMLESGKTVMPTQPVILLALLSGFGVATQRAMAILEGKPQEHLEQTVKMLVAQMRTVQVATAEVLPAATTTQAARTLADVHAKAQAQAQAEKDAGVTPKRVDPPTPGSVL